MLVIRMQRTGRKGHAMFRVVVQDSRYSPTSGKVIARLGSYDPHAKTVVLDKEKTGFYLEHGAQPSDRAIGILKNEGVKLPKWVKLPDEKKRQVRNADKRRSTRPDEPEAEESAAAEPATEEPAAPEQSAAEPAETSEAPAETPAEETSPSEPTSVSVVEAPASDEAPSDVSSEVQVDDKKDA